MIAIELQLQQHAGLALQAQFNIPIASQTVTINETKPEFTGDYTIVLFAWVKQLGKSPNQIGEAIGNYLLATHPNLYTAYNIVKGFLNITIADAFWISHLASNNGNANYGNATKNNKKVMVEYSSPNTNKPLHLGHLRNNFLGFSTAKIYEANGYNVIKTCIVNDRGIHICKSMIAWQLFANGATPESTNTKGDHFVGKYYVKFNDNLKLEIAALIAQGTPEKEAEKTAPSMQAAQAMLLKWEQGDMETLALWRTMNTWVYLGFNETYTRIGTSFDKIYYESNTYLLGKKFVDEGLINGVFSKKNDGSVWIDLTAEGLDEKLLLRKDGTSVYITQDIGLAESKVKEYGIEKSIYVIGDEQNYHMQVLSKIAKKLNLPNADGIHHLSYGMIELTTGKMKSREGTVVDADDLLNEMEATAKETTEALGKVKDFSEAALDELYKTLSLGALKFYLLKVNPKKRMVFNPAESIDMQGFTGPFIQYTYARINSILNGNTLNNNLQIVSVLLPDEINLIKILEAYPKYVVAACTELDPSIIANQTYNLAKNFNSFYNALSVLKADSEEKKQLRLQICAQVAHVIKHGLGLLGITAPQRM